MVSYDLFLFRLKIETSTQGANSMPFLVFAVHICGSGSFAVQFGDSFRSGDHFWSGSFAAKYRTAAGLIVMLPSRTSLLGWFYLFKQFRSAGTNGFIFSSFPFSSIWPTFPVQNKTICFFASASAPS